MFRSNVRKCNTEYSITLNDCLLVFIQSINGTHVHINEQAGTYLYHAHYGMQREEGLNGMIQVKPARGQREPFVYDFDRSIMLTDWYHKTALEHAIGLSSVPFVWVGEPQVINI